MVPCITTEFTGYTLISLINYNFVINQDRNQIMVLNGANKLTYFYQTQDLLCCIEKSCFTYIIIPFNSLELWLKDPFIGVDYPYSLFVIIFVSWLFLLFPSKTPYFYLHFNFQSVSLSTLICSSTSPCHLFLGVF